MSNIWLMKYTSESYFLHSWQRPSFPKEKDCFNCVDMLKADFVSSKIHTNSDFDAIGSLPARFQHHYTFK